MSVASRPCLSNNRASPATQGTACAPAMALQPTISFSAAATPECIASAPRSMRIENVIGIHLQAVLVILRSRFTITPIISVADVLHEPFEGQGMTQPLGLGELIGLASDSGELQTLRALRSEE